MPHLALAIEDISYMSRRVSIESVWWNIMIIGDGIIVTIISAITTTLMVGHASLYNFQSVIMCFQTDHWINFNSLWDNGVLARLTLLYNLTVLETTNPSENEVDDVGY